MSMIIYIFLLATSVFLIGCRRAPDSEECRMLEIENLTVKEKALTLDYRVSNSFEQDIWICEDIDIYNRYDVETRFNTETVWIKLCLNLERNLSVGDVFAKYRRLSPGNYHSGKILLKLPIRNASPVYDFGERHKKHKEGVLHRVVFEVGYFEGELINSISVALDKAKGRMSIEKIQKTQFEPRIEEEIEDGQLHKFLYCSHNWPGIGNEKSDKVEITNVNIPCSIAVDDK